MGRLLKPRRLILASASPQRRKLLRGLGLPFRVVASEVGEDSAEPRPARLVTELALRKASAVAARFPQALILGADTIVVQGGKVLVKPRDRADAARILGRLNGRWHRVYTGVALVDGRSGKSWRAVAVSRVKARRLPPAELARLSAKHLDKAGAYAVQDTGDPFIERILGPLDNVVGLPLAAVRQLLRRASRERR